MRDVHTAKKKKVSAEALAYPLEQEQGIFYFHFFEIILLCFALASRGRRPCRRCESTALHRGVRSGEHSGQVCRWHIPWPVYTAAVGGDPRSDVHSEYVNTCICACKSHHLKSQIFLITFLSPSFFFICIMGMERGHTALFFFLSRGLQYIPPVRSPVNIRYW